uniref:hypothetical protein n=1 Tax=Treponema sp. TaxID=166 RepID=UPI00388F9F3A
MINPKYICVSACVGFCLSFFVGLISDVRFSYVCLRAFIFALVFAGLSVGISFLYKKFLSSDIGFSSDSESSPVHPAAGSVVNIVVDDSNLADDEHAPHFEVSNISQTKSFGGDLENGKNEDKEQLDNIETAKIKTEEVQSFTPASVSTLTSSPSDSS